MGQILLRVETERGRFLHWVPIFLATGIGGYFLWPNEPSETIYMALGGFVLLMLAVRWRLPWGYGPVAGMFALVALGICLAGARAHYVAGPVLGYRYYGAIEGRVVAMDRSQSDAVRLTLDQVRLSDTAPDRVPRKVRVSLLGAFEGGLGAFTPQVGARVALTGHLSGPNGPVEPGGFDFQRMAWFRGIGAVGYTRTPVMLLAPANGSGVRVQVTRTRMAIANWVRGILPGETGAFAAAVTTGDRSAMGQDTLAALRGANLAHLLAISGLHMGLLTGFVYQAMRYLLALVPWVALRFPTKKYAALAAIGAGGVYLLLSGGSISTERAFIMVSTMLVAILFDRRALSLRAVAMAAILVLLLHPEALTEPGFQMSFAATTALVAVFGWLRRREGWRAPKWAQPVLAVLVSSAVAAAATAPFGAAHFNQVSHFGLIANLVSVPLMGAVIMPAAVVAALLSPFGLGWVAISAMGPPIGWIIFVAHWVSSLDGAIGHVPQPPSSVLPLVAIGGLLVVLLRRWERALALLPLCLAAFLWAQATRPLVLISQTGGLVGVLTPEGRALSKPKGDGFAAKVWLENDGAPMAQAAAYQLGEFSGAKGLSETTIAGKTLVHLTGKSGAKQLQAACAYADFVVMNSTILDTVPVGCQVFDVGALRASGAVALWPTPNGLSVETARDRQGNRLWTHW
ncbi:ComEC/Rec2 family competence protein [Planktotalea lamellibrachiae]|nr:ComEC/Rec2 family competence protein [Aliiroseovarius lamellibrachiae]MBT2130788.1 ComEC/Rec2 family competence protein [Aliiroseovarius lamellibrachiae]